MNKKCNNISIIYLDAPKMSAKLENVSINEGQDAEFNAKFISNPAPFSVTWFKNEKDEVTVSETVAITSTENTSQLKDVA